MRFCQYDKGCKYPVFGTDKVTGKGYCRSHQTQRTDFDRRTIIQKAMAKQNGLQNKIRKLGDKLQDEESKNLSLWFLDRMKNCDAVCENCGARKDYLKTNENCYKLWKSCQAHLLPKRHFKSIQSHPLNGMVFGTGYSGMCFCHDDYDHDWERASTMKIWPEVVRRFKILYPLIRKSEYQFIPQVLLNTISTNTCQPENGKGNEDNNDD